MAERKAEVYKIRYMADCPHCRRSYEWLGLPADQETKICVECKNWFVLKISDFEKELAKIK